MAHVKIPYLEVAAIVTGWPTRTGRNQAIAEHFGITLATAQSWVKHTRKRGYLPRGDDSRPCRHCDGTGLTRWGPPTRRTGE